MSMDENSITPPLSPDNPYRLDIEDSDMMFADDVARQFPSTPIHFPDEGQLMDVQEPAPTYSNQRPFTCLNIESVPKQLESLLKTVEAAYVPDLDNVVELFGYQFVTCQLEQNMNKLFLFLSQWICRIQNKNPPPVSEIRRWRQDIVNFYVFLKSYVLRYNGGDQQLPPLLNSLLSHLHSTLLYVDTPTKIHYNSMCRVDSDEYNSFHLCLDVYWETLELLCLIVYKFQDLPCRQNLIRCCHRKEEDPTSMFTQVVDLVLWELVTLAQQVYSKLSTKEALGASPYPCPCVEEMWTLCIVLLRHKHGSEQLFWFHINNILQILQEEEVPENTMEIDSGVFVYPAASPILKDRTGFCLWLLTKLAMLHDDSSKSLSRQHTSDCNYQEVMAALKKSLAKTDLSEVDLRFYLQCCVTLAEQWKPNVSLLLLLWDHFYRKLNSSFMLNMATVEGLGTISKSSLTLLELCNRLGSGQYKFKPQDTSFQLYLGLLGNSLHQLLDSGSNQEWRQMKGRVYSKFHKRRVQELTENGFYNFTCLFLCLSLAADTEDVTGKLCDFYNMVDMSSLSLGTSQVMWMGMFTMVHLYQQKNLDISILTDRLGQAFSNTCVEFSSDDLDPRRRHLLWKLISFYIESVQEVFESSSKLGPAHSRLISEGFASVLHGCRSNELGPVLGTLEAVITRIRETKKKTGMEKTVEDMYNVLQTSVLPAIKTLSCSQSASPLLADTLAGLSLLAFDSKKEDFICLVKFVHGGSINRSVCCRFWSHLLPADGVITAMSTMVPNYQTELIQTWISSTVFLPAQSQHLITMNRCMQALPEVRDMMKQAGINNSEITEKSTCLHFIKAMDLAYTKTTMWKDRIQLREKAMNYFSNILRQLSPILQTLKPAETLANAYAVMGYIVKCCAQLLFIQAKPDCPLPNIISAMVVPHFLFNSDKAVSPVFLAVARDHLHLFVRGLGRLDYKKAPYVQRRLKDIVSIYIPKFWTSSSSLSVGTASSVHPLVVSLKESCVRQPIESALEFRKFLFEAVLEKFLVPSQFSLPPNHHLALLFLREVIGRTNSKEVAVRDTLTVLGSVLTVMVLSDVQSTHQCAQKIATRLLEDCKVLPTNSPAAVTATLEAFVTVHKKTHLDHCIKVLDKVSKAGGIFISNLLPKLQHYIVDHESHRGIGSDSKLRQNYISLSKNVS